MKQTYTAKIDTKGLKQALTTVAIAGALAGWAVLARPEAPTAASTTSITAAAPVASALGPAGGAVAASSAAPAATGLREVSIAPSSLRVVSAPAAVTTTRSSR